MVKNKNQENRRGREAMLWGWIWGIILGLLCMVLFAWFMTVKDVGDVLVQIFAYIIIVVSCFFGGWISGKKKKNQGYKIGAIVGGLIFLTILLVGMFTNGLNDLFGIGIKASLSVLVGTVGGMVGVNSSAKSRMKI